MELTRTEKILKNIAAVLGIVQGITWFILTVICITYYIKETSYPTNGDSYMGGVNNQIYSMFLAREKESTSFEDQTLTPGVFFGFMWTYLFLDIAWIAVSFFVLCIRYPKTALKFWIFFTTILCVFDFILVIILGADYDKCMTWVRDQNLGTRGQQACANAILPVLMIAAKGFLLWVINVIFIIVAVRMIWGFEHQTYDQRYTSPQFENPIVPQPIPSPRLLSPSPQLSSGGSHYPYPQSPTVARNSLPSPSRRQPQYNYYSQSPLSPAPVNGLPRFSGSAPPSVAGQRLHWSGFNKSPPPPPNPKPFVLAAPPRRY